MHVKLTLLLTNSMQTKQQIKDNANLKKISLPQLKKSVSFFGVRDDPSPPNPQPLPFPSHSQSIPPSILTGFWQSNPHEAVRIQA